MFRSAAVCVSIALLAAVAAGSAVAAPEVGCQNDSKLIGRIQLSTADTPGTWWHLTREGFDAAGITDYKAAIESIFGTPFPSLNAAVDALVDAVRALDKNGNEYVCASSLRGTREFLGDPNWALFFFGVLDDKHVTG